MFYLVYKITNEINGMSYVGAHMTKRKDDGYCGSGKRIREAIKEFGIENFSKEILYEANSIEEMLRKEIELIELGEHSYNTVRNNYDWHLHPPAALEAMSIAASKKTGEKNSQYGTKWITNGVINRKLRQNEEMPEGWKFGRVKGTVPGTHFVKFKIKSHT